MENLGKDYSGRNTTNYSQHFANSWNNKFEFEFNFTYGNFAEQRYLLNYLKINRCKSLLDVGCANAITYRFLKNFLNKTDFDYRGVNLSRLAIKCAKALYPNLKVFHNGKESLHNYFDKKFDIFSFKRYCYASN